MKNNRLTVIGKRKWSMEGTVKYYDVTIADAYNGH